MRISIGMILNEMKDLHPEIIHLKNIHQPIKAVKFYTPEATLADPEILYIANSSDFPAELPKDTLLNIFILNHTLRDKKKDFAFDNDYPINLIKIALPMDPCAFFNIILNISAAHQEDQTESASLLQLLAHSTGFQQIIDLGYQMLGNPLYAMDMGSNVLAMTDWFEISDDYMWTEILNTGHLSYQTIKSSKDTGRIVDHAEAPVIVKDGLMNYRRIVGNVMVTDKQVGVIFALEYEKPFSPGDLEIVTLLCNAISLEMQKNRNNYYSYEAFILDLLEGKLKDHQNIIEKTKIFRLDFHKYLYILTIDVNDYDTTGSIMYIRDMLNKALGNNRSIIYDGHIVIILSCNNISNFNRTTLRMLKEFLQLNNMYGGISRSYVNLEHTQEYYRQSIQALKLGRRLNKGERLFPYDSYAVYHIAETCNSMSDLISYCHPALLGLIAFDQINNTDHTYSLNVYIKNNKNIAEAANVLHIHRNTMVYRIKKISEITNIDLNDSDVMLHVHLSLEFLKYLDYKVFYNRI